MQATWCSPRVTHRGRHQYAAGSCCPGPRTLDGPRSDADVVQVVLDVVEEVRREGAHRELRPVAAATRPVPRVAAHRVEGRGSRPDPRPTSVPVLQLVPTRDVAVREAAVRSAERWAERRERQDVPYGHWVALSHPEVVADAVRAFTAKVDRGESGGPGGAA